MKLITIISSMAVLLLAGCGGWGSLVGWQPTVKSIKPSDIAGNWTYNQVLVELNESGTFTITGSEEYAGYGRWQLDYTAKIAEITLNYKDKPISITAWFVTEMPDGSFAVVGGNGDGDTWQPMKRVDKMQMPTVTPTS